MSKAKTKAPEQTFEEVKYLRYLIDHEIPVRIRLSSNEEVTGIIEFYDPTSSGSRATASPICFCSNTTLSICTKSRRATARQRSAHSGTLRADNQAIMPSYLETSVEIAREAGAAARFFERHVTFELKGEYDLVTEADRASEQLVVERLRAHFPSHSIVAEEGGGHTGSRNIAGTSIRWMAPRISRTAFRCTTSPWRWSSPGS